MWFGINADLAAAKCIDSRFKYRDSFNIYLSIFTGSNMQNIRGILE